MGDARVAHLASKDCRNSEWNGNSPVSADKINKTPSKCET